MLNCLASSPLDLLGPHLQEKCSSMQLSPLAARVMLELVTFKALLELHLQILFLKGLIPIQPQVLSQPGKKGRCPKTTPTQFLTVAMHKCLNTNIKLKGGRTALYMARPCSFSPQGFTGTKLKVVVKIITWGIRSSSFCSHGFQTAWAWADWTPLYLHITSQAYPYVNITEEPTGQVFQVPAHPLLLPHHKTWSKICDFSPKVPSHFLLRFPYTEHDQDHGLVPTQSHLY